MQPPRRKMRNPLLLALCGVAGYAAAQDVAFDQDIAAAFLEYAEAPLKSIKQRGEHKTPKNPIREIRRTDKTADTSRPIIHFVTAPGCGACNRLKASVNRGSEARQLLKSFDVVYLNGPGGMPWTDKWCELGHEGYIPQVYFYSRDGRPLNVVNEGKNEWNWHAFVSEDALVPAMQAAISRDDRIARGEDFDTVVGKEKPPPPPPPSPPPSPADSGCMEGWAGEDCDECAPGWSGEDCDVPPSAAAAADS
eukprot:COSAG05_NODE_553_length_8711_cov_165.199257_7_plen_249_part_01